MERGNGVRPIWAFTRPRDQLREHNFYKKLCGSRIKQMFWAAFRDYYRTSLVPVDRDPESYRGGVTVAIIRVLYKAFLPDILRPGDIFMQDNAPVHTARLVRDALEQIDINVIDWPPYSPDLNPIENLWALTLN